MALRINANSASLIAQRSLERSTDKLGDNFRRLSTGLRIGRAGDDAAGLAISERLRAKVRSVDQASRNANDGISLVQTAEGSLAEVQSILLRLRELAVQSSTGTLGTQGQETVDEEFQQLTDEIGRIGRSAEFNGITLLDGGASSVSLQVGFGTTSGVDTIDISIASVSDTTLGLDALDIGSGGAPSTAIVAVDAAIDTISNIRGRLGAYQNRLGAAIGNLASQSLSMRTAESRIRDVDVAEETAALTRNSILQRASLSILAQANSNPRSALDLLG